MNKKLSICEVGPRDGFQNIRKMIPTETKLAVIDALFRSGIQKMQITSFVNPKAVPQLRDSNEVVKHCLEKYKGKFLYALTANRRGVEDAEKCGMHNLSFVTSVTDGHNMANINKTVAESVEELRTIIRDYSDMNIVWDIAMAFGCAFDGPVSSDMLIHHIEKGIEIGLHSFNLCDSIGIATPDMIEDRITKLRSKFPEASFRVHIHDTRNMGIINSYTAVQCGITEIETSIGGLGGCPFVPGAKGNTSTEDLIYMLNHMGYKTGIDFDKLLNTAKYVKSVVNGNYSGHHIDITTMIAH